MSRRRRILLIVAIVVFVPLAGIGITAVVAPETLMQLVVPAPPAAEPLPPVKYSMDSEIRALLNHPTTKELVDKHLPGLAEIEQIEVAGPLTLRQVQPYYPGLLADEKLAAFQAELDQLPPLEQPVVYSTDVTEIGTLLDDPDARAIIDKHLPEFSGDPQVHLTRPFTFRFIQPYATDKLTDEALDAIDADLQKLTEAKAQKSEEPAEETTE